MRTTAYLKATMEVYGKIITGLGPKSTIAPGNIKSRKYQSRIPKTNPKHQTFIIFNKYILSNHFVRLQLGPQKYHRTRKYKKQEKEQKSQFFTYKCRLLIAFANSLDPDQARLNVRSDLYPSYLTLRWYF